MVDCGTYNRMNPDEQSEWHRLRRQGWPDWVIRHSGARDTHELEEMYGVAQLADGTWAIVRKADGVSTGFESDRENAVRALWTDAIQNFGR